MNVNYLSALLLTLIHRLVWPCFCIKGTWVALKAQWTLLANASACRPATGEDGGNERRKKGNKNKEEKRTVRLRGESQVLNKAIPCPRNFMESRSV